MDRSDPGVERILAATLVLALALSGLLRVLDPWGLGHDAVLYLHCGELLLDGNRPYVDFVDVNPPLVMYLSTIPVAVGRMFHVSPILAAQVGVVAGTIAAVGAAMHVLFRAGAPRAGVLALGNGMALGDQLVALLGASGQREHLFALAALPWLCLRSTHWRGHRGLTIGLALVTGVLASLKPQFLVCLIAAEAAGCAAARRRPSLDLELGVLLLAPLLYAAHFALLPSEVRDAFFTRVIPMVVDGYHLWDSPPVGKIWIAAAIGAVLATVGAVRRDALVTAMGAFVLGSTAVVWQQHKFWFYHFVPALLVGVAGIAFVLPSILRGATALAATVWGGALAAVAYLCATATWSDDGLTTALSSRVSPGDGLLVISAEVGDTYPALVRLDLEPGSRWLWTFPVPILHAHRTGPDATSAEEAFARELALDADARSPRWLLLLRRVESETPRPGIELDTRAWLESTEAGRSLLGSYGSVGEVVHTTGATRQHLEILERN